MGKGQPDEADRRILGGLDADIVESARRTVDGLVARSGGQSASGPVVVDGLVAIAALFQVWAEHLGASENLAPGTMFRFESQPGLWRALQALVPLDDPDRWNALRAAVIKRLESLGWEREVPPRGSVFRVPKGGKQPSVTLTEEQKRAIAARRAERRRDR
jgi:hypothetical protein